MRALAHPGAVLALVVLALNDHVLKEAWPGFVTGKLSDVAGLVVAPLLLAVVAAMVGVRRPLPVALVLTGAGFAAVKAFDGGAAVASALWSLGFPTTMRADPADLLTLPALAGAWWVDSRSRRLPDVGWRRTVAVATGMAVLPVAVLTTAATNCVGDEGVVSLYAVEGRLTGTDARQAFLVDDASSGGSTVDLTGAVRATTYEEPERLDRTGTYDRPQPVDPEVADVRCDASGVRCWRLRDDRTVEVSEDSGTTWAQDLALSEEDEEELLEGVDPGCSVKASARLSHLGVLGTGDRATVALAARHTGVWFRDREGRWRLVARDELGGRTPTETPPRGRLRLVAVLPRGTELHESATPTATPTPTPTCASPTPSTVTPNPLNGPPTTYDVCP